MSEQNSTVNDYFGSGSNYTLKAGANKGVKVKSIAVEEKETDGVVSRWVNIVYVHPQPEVPEDDWSEMKETIFFPKPYQGETTVNKDSLKYGFLNPMIGFFENFSSKDAIKERFAAVLSKLGVTDFTFDNVETLHTQLKTLFNGWFDLVKGGIYNVEGTLICGYKAPKEVDGETKQYLQVASYGQSGCYKSAFRTNNSEELPAEQTVFSNEKDRKYKYWSYSRTKSESQEEQSTETPTTTDTGW